MADRKRATKAPSKPRKRASSGQRRRTNQQRKWQPEFLQALADTGTVVQACKAAGISRSAAYRARQADEDFALAWHDVDETFIETLERVAYVRALNGSDRLIEFLLKAKRPAVYRESSLNVHHSGGLEPAKPELAEPDTAEAELAIAKILRDAGAITTNQATSRP